MTYIINILDSWVVHTAADNGDTYIFESALDYPDITIVKQDITGDVKKDPNVMTCRHITNDANHVTTLENDPKYFVVSVEEV